MEKKYLVNRKKNNFVKEGSKFRDKSSKQKNSLIQTI